MKSSHSVELHEARIIGFKNGQNETELVWQANLRRASEKSDYDLKEANKKIDKACHMIANPDTNDSEDQIRAFFQRWKFRVSIGRRLALVKRGMGSVEKVEESQEEVKQSYLEQLISYNLVNTQKERNDLMRKVQIQQDLIEYQEEQRKTVAKDLNMLEAENKKLKDHNKRLAAICKSIGNEKQFMAEHINDLNEKLYLSSSRLKKAPEKVKAAPFNLEYEVNHLVSDVMETGRQIQKRLRDKQRTQILQTELFDLDKELDFKDDPIPPPPTRDQNDQTEVEEVPEPVKDEVMIEEEIKEDLESERFDDLKEGKAILDQGSIVDKKEESGGPDSLEPMTPIGYTENENENELEHKISFITENSINLFK